MRTTKSDDTGHALETAAFEHGDRPGPDERAALSHWRRMSGLEAQERALRGDK